jgi:hypothetical protein
VNYLIGLLPKSAEMVTHLPHSIVQGVSRVVGGRSCGGRDAKGQLPAISPLLMKCSHIGLLRVLFHMRIPVLCTPHRSSILCVLGGRQGGVSIMIFKICSVLFGHRQKVPMIDGTV